MTHTDNGIHGAGSYATAAGDSHRPRTLSAAQPPQASSPPCRSVCTLLVAPQPTTSPPIATTEVLLGYAASCRLSKFRCRLPPGRSLCGRSPARHLSLSWQQVCKCPVRVSSARSRRLLLVQGSRLGLLRSRGNLPLMAPSYCHPSPSRSLCGSLSAQHMSAMSQLTCQGPAWVPSASVRRFPTRHIGLRFCRIITVLCPRGEFSRAAICCPVAACASVSQHGTCP